MGSLRSNTHLLQKQFPVYPDRSFAVFLAVLAETTAHFSHAFQAVTAIQQVFDVLGHHLRHVLQLVIELVQVLRRSGILVGLFRSLDEGVEFDVCVGSAYRGEVLLRGIGRREFLLKVRKVRECELAGIRLVAYADEN